MDETLSCVLIISSISAFVISSMTESLTALTSDALFEPEKKPNSPNIEPSLREASLTLEESLAHPSTPTSPSATRKMESPGSPSRKRHSPSLSALDLTFLTTSRNSASLKSEKSGVFGTVIADPCLSGGRGAFDAGETSVPARGPASLPGPATP